MAVFKHILVPTDFEEPAERAIDIAIELARAFDAQITLLHVYPDMIPVPYSGVTSWPFEEIEANARRQLEAQWSATRARFPNGQGMLVPGIAWEQILATAQLLGADLIVMGTHGRRGLAHAMMGSVAERVVRCARLPVLTVRASQKADEQHAT